MATAVSPSRLFVSSTGGVPRVASAVLLPLLSLVLPGVAFGLVSWRHPHWLLWTGMALQTVGALALLSRWSERRELPVHGVLGLYLLVLLCLWPAAFVYADTYLNVAVGVVLVIVLLTAGLSLLEASGAPDLRRARLAAARLARRQHWPEDLAACRSVPEVAALKDALRQDLTPALALVCDQRPQVQVAALAALEGRSTWDGPQSRLLLDTARHAPEAAVRAAVLTTLAMATRRPIIEGMAEFLRDPEPLVRQAAIDALLCDPRHRWQWIRAAVQSLLADPVFAADGSLLRQGALLPPEIVDDLRAWASQKGTLAVRAALTLQTYYHHAVEHATSGELLTELHQQLADPQSSAGLRTDLAQLLQRHHLLDVAILEQLLSDLNPAPLRLVAAGALLAQSEHEQAIAALRDLARLPNREIALATAELVQRHLAVDLGLPIGKPLPPVHTRQAAEVTRRVMAWAAGQETAAPKVSRVRTRV